MAQENSDIVAEGTVPKRTLGYWMTTAGFMIIMGGALLAWIIVRHRL